MAKRSARSLATEAAFRAAVARANAALIQAEWLGAGRPHHVRCANGHDCWPRPHDVCRGTGICRACAGLDPATAEMAFRARIAEQGGIPVYRQWLGVHQPHHVRCGVGHDCWPHPSSLRDGKGICRACARQDPATAEAAFRAQLEAADATLLEPGWLGADKPHHVRCASGHDCWPRPSGVCRRGRGICRPCGYVALSVSRLAGPESAAAEAAFRARLAELAALPRYDQWLGVNRPHHVLCVMGHDCYPRPGGVLQGDGPCRVCAGKVWDVFYTVADEAKYRVKFGVTSGDPRPRLAAHHRRGYRTVARLATDLPPGVAPGAEKAVKATLALASERPVHGTEYFDLSCLGLIVDVADSWLPAEHAPVLAIAA